MQSEKRVEGVRIAPGMERVNHLLFADDCLLFLKAELRQVSNLKQLLFWYEKVAGQRINSENSEFICSPNLDAHMVTVLGSCLGMMSVKVAF